MKAMVWPSQAIYVRGARGRTTIFGGQWTARPPLTTHGSGLALSMPDTPMRKPGCAGEREVHEPGANCRLHGRGLPRVRPGKSSLRSDGRVRTFGLLSG